MVTTTSMVSVALISLGLVVTPGPNMVYLASRSIAQGRAAGLASLAGVALGFILYLTAAASGLGALFAAVPLSYEIVRILGGLYLMYLAWTMLRPGGTSPFHPRVLAPHSRRRLFGMGLVTCLLNPKIALLYAALIPQFVTPERGSTFLQFIQLGAAQVLVAVSVNGLIVLAAASVSGFLAARPTAQQFQRWVSGTVLGGFAIHVLASRRPA